ncbi:MAG TPA: hypothetical protein VHV81_01745 [Steroidobacteraceae bacterium]|jgi:hypothetical protein|nr:hypothetical protein [Steroidobacteraceae bacterium]
MTPETRAFEYALGLFAVLIGLAVADIATSFHRLVRSKAVLVWDPLALGAALYALFMAVCIWFDIWGVRNFAATRHFLFYVSLVAELFVLFLIAAASLPDEPGQGTDLRAYYAGNRRYFWFLVSLYQLVYLADGIFFVGGMLLKLPLGYTVLAFVQMGLPLAVSASLAMVKSRSYHYVALGLLYAIMLYHFVPMAID